MWAYRLDWISYRKDDDDEDEIAAAMNTKNINDNNFNKELYK